MDIKDLSNEEISVLRNLTLIGGILIDRAVFIEWTGVCEGAIDSLAERGLVQLCNDGSGAMLSISADSLDTVHEHLKPDLRNCAWAADVLDRIVDDLSAQHENAKLRTGANSRIWHEPDMYERAICVMNARLALNILDAIDPADAESISICIDFLSRVICNDVHNALYFGLSGAAQLLERVTGSPCFGSLPDSQKFDALNMLGIAWVAVLGDYLIKLPGDYRYTLPEHRLLRAIFGKRGYKKHVERFATERVKDIVKIFYKETGFIADSIVKHYTDTERFVNSLPAKDKSIYHPLIFLPLMQFLVSVCKNYGGRPLFYNGGKVFSHIRNFEKRNDLSEETSAAFLSAYDDYRSGLFPKSIVTSKKKAEAAPNEGEADSAQPEEEDPAKTISSKRSYMYYKKISKCISIRRFDKITAELFEDEILQGRDKLHKLQRMVMLLGFSPFKSVISRHSEEELRILTEQKIEDGTPVMADLILYCSEARKLRRAQKSLSRISLLMESTETSTHEKCLHHAQLIMVAAAADDGGSVSELVDRYYSHMPADPGDEQEHIWVLLMPVVLAIELAGVAVLERLYKRS